MLINTDLQIALLEQTELARRVKWYINLRWFFLIVLSVVGIFSDYLIANAEKLRLADTLAFTLCLAINLALYIIARFIRKLPAMAILALFQIIFDIFIASYVVYAHGGAQSRTIILYAIPIIMSGALFGRIAAYLAALISAFAYSITIIIYATGWAQQYTVMPLYLTPTDELIIPITFYVCVFFILAALGDFLSGINALTEQELAGREAISLASHQLRTPATAVKGFLSAIIDSSKTMPLAKQHEYIIKAYEENERELQLVDTMLLVVQAEGKALKLQPASTDLRTLVNDAVAKHPPRIERAGQHLHVDIAKKADYHCMVDPKLIRLVIDNLLDNASKYTPERGTIHIGLEASDQTVQLSVADSGIGIAKRDIPKLFKRYSRIPAGAAFSSSGSGLGLYLVKKIVDAHQGGITVTSSIGHGTTFKVQLRR